MRAGSYSMPRTGVSSWAVTPRPVYRSKRRPLSLLVETNAASRLVANVEKYPGTHWIVNLGGRLDLGRRTRLDFFLTENIISQQTTTDFAIYTGLTVRP